MPRHPEVVSLTRPAFGHRAEAWDDLGHQALLAFLVIFQVDPRPTASSMKKSPSKPTLHREYHRVGQGLTEAPQSVRVPGCHLSKPGHCSHWCCTHSPLCLARGLGMLALHHVTTSRREHMAILCTQPPA